MSLLTARYLSIGLFFILSTNFLLAQNSRAELKGEAANARVDKSTRLVLDKNQNPSFIEFENSVHINSENDLKAALRINRKFLDFKQGKITVDRMGFTHRQFDQYYQGLKVIGAEFYLHDKDNQTRTANGHYFDDVNVDVHPLISYDDAKSGAVNAIEELSQVKLEHKDYTVQGELSISRKGYDIDAAHHLVYQFEVYMESPVLRYLVEIDAHDGGVVNIFNMIHFNQVDGTGNTLYDGEVDLDLTQNGAIYEMIDGTRGDRIVTYDMHNGTSYGASTIVSESDAHFNEDPTAVSAHFGAGATYDYFFSQFGRNSYDDEGAEIRSYVHYSNNYFNAFWDGYRMTYGDGDGVTATALVSLDIVGHEIAHAVTEHSADLYYYNQSGALNESFSDIFGQSIEFSTFPATASWNLGDQIYLDGVSMIRSMSNPKSKGHPDTYFGEYWYTGPDDNGGVHWNSGVQNYWYYLLVEGGSGTNDKNYMYDVVGIGRNSAEQIAYRNLTVYLSSTSDYIDARVGAEQAAVDLFGEGSNEHLSVMEAWDAVGVPRPIPVLSIAQEINFGTSPIEFNKPVEVEIMNLGAGELQVYDINFSDDKFSVSDTSFTVDELSDKTLTFYFQPSSLGNMVGTATLYSNDDTVAIDLSGTGVLPPSISVSPSSISHVLDVGDDHSTNISVSNTNGESDLIVSYRVVHQESEGGASFEIEETQTIGAASADNALGSVSRPYAKGIKTSSSSSVSILFFTDGGPTVMRPVLESLDYDVTMYVGDFSSFIQELNSGSWDLALFEAYHNGYDLSQMIDYVASGGKLITSYWNYDTELEFLEVMDAQFETEITTPTVLHAWKPSHEVFNFPNKIPLPMNWVSDGILDNGDELSALIGGEAISGSVENFETDKATIIVGNNSKTLVNGIALTDYTDRDEDDNGIDDINELFENQLNYILYGGWIKLSSFNDTIPPGQSKTLGVTLDASGILGGVYEANIAFDSNDPDDTNILMPVDLTVNGVPDISVNTDSVDFGIALLGAAVEQQVSIRNIGTDLLEIDTIVVTNPVFELDTVYAELRPKTYLNVRITYLPSSAGSDLGSMYIVSNASNDTIILELNGLCKEPPIFDVINDSFQDTLNTSDSSSFVFQISNSGSSEVADLTFDISFESPSVTEIRSVSRPAMKSTPISGVSYHQNRVIVRRNQETSFSDMRSLRQSINAYVIKRFKLIDAELWSVSDVGVEEAVGILNAHPGITYAEPDYELNLIRQPDDESFDELWGMHNTGQSGGTPDADIDALEAWSKGKGSKNVIIGVIDTGIDPDHEDLNDNMWINEDEIPDNGVDDDNNGYVDDVYGWDFVNDDNDPFDDNGHGTHCAGTIAAEGNNGIGVVGVNWKASLMALKFLGSGGSGNTSDAIEALEYAILNGANLTSNSWGGGGYSAAMEEMIWAANDANQLFVAAAGNANNNNDASPYYPSSYPNDNLISVAASDHNDMKASFSSYGATSVDIAAPGVNIYSCQPNDGYASLNGTSMATPHVAGAAALAWSSAPFLSNMEIKEILLSTVDPVEAFEGITLSGGRLNLSNVMDQAISWVAVNKETGSIQGSDTESITLKFNATGLVAGLYQANMIISTNDIVTPVQTLAVELKVEGEPKMELSTDTLYFNAFTNYDTAEYITIGNIGTDTLTITQTSTDTSIFSVGSGLFELLPEEDTTLRVSLTADETGIATGHLIIHSSDTSNSVDSVFLSGMVLNPPLIGIDVDTLFKTLNSGDTSSGFITIDNTLGGSELFARFELTPKPNDTSFKAIDGADAGTLEYSDDQINHSTKPVTGYESVLVIQNYSSWGLDLHDMVETLFGLDADVIGGHELTGTDFSNYDLIITAGGQGTSYYNYISDNVSKFEEYVLQGGIVEYHLATQGAFVDVVGNVTVAYGDLEVENRIVHDHPITSGIEGLIQGFYANHTYLEDLPDHAEVLTITNNSEVPTTAKFRHGLGTVVVTGLTLEYLYRNDYNGGKILPNMMGYTLGLANKNWLSPNVFADTIPAGETREIGLTWNASGLSEGLYERNLVVSSNDPANEEMVIPASITVNHSSGIATDSLIGFSDILVTDSVTKTVQIHSIGSDTLEIQNVYIKNGLAEFKALILETELSPGETTELIVSFVPKEVNEFVDTVVILSNDPSDPLVYLPIYGRSGTLPSIEVSPTELNLELHTGEKETRTLTIDNSAGGTPLMWSASVDYLFQGPSSSSPTISNIPIKEVNKGEVDNRIGPAVVASSGGPDEYGYRWRDSKNGGLNFEWIDIAETGTDITGNMSDDNVSGPYPMGFNVPFYDGEYSEFYVSSNGFIRFEENNNSGCCSGQPLPSQDGINNILAWNWRDGYPFGNVYYENFDDKTVIQFEGYGLCCSEGNGTVNAEVVIYRSGFIRYNYRSFEGNYLNGSGSIGIENSDGTDGLQVAFNTSYLEDSLSVMFTQVPEWLSLVEQFGIVPAGESTDVEVTASADDMFGGNYDAGIVIKSNDTTNSEVLVPVSLVVTDAADISVSDSLVTFSNVSIGLTRQSRINVFNRGKLDLIVTSITSDNPLFTLDSSSLMLEYGESRDLVIKYAPTEVRYDTALITLITNDPDMPSVFITAIGNGLEPPEMVVSPLAFDESLETGEKVTRTLTVSNSGGANDLIVDFDKWVPKEPLFSGIKDVLVIRDYVANDTTIEDVLRHAFDVEPFVLRSSQIEDHDFSTYQMIIVVPKQSQSYYQEIGQQVSKFEAYVRTGGALLYYVQMYNATPVLVGGVTTTYAWNYNQEIIDDHFITDGFEGTMYGHYANTVFSNIPENNVEITSGTYTSQPTSISYQFGRGSVFATGVAVEEHYHNSPDRRWFLEKSLEYGLGLPTDHWVNILPGDTINGGDSKEYSLEISAEGLYAGDFTSEIRVRGNDPDNLVDTVLIALSVSGSPEVHVEDSLAFLGCYNNFTYEQFFTLTNEGTDTLWITSVDIEENRFTSEIAVGDYVLPGRTNSYSVEFSSSNTGEFLSDIQIGTNDADEVEVTIPVYGISRIKPTISLTQNEVELTVYPNVLSSTDITIENEGEYDLQYQSNVGHIDNEAMILARSKIGFYAIDREGSQEAAPSQHASNGIASLNFEGVIDTLQNIPSNVYGSVVVDQFMYYVRQNIDTLYKYDLSTESVVDQYFLSGNTYSSNTDLEFDGENFWISESNGNLYAYNEAIEFVGSVSSPVQSYLAFTIVEGNILVTRMWDSDDYYLMDFAGQVLDTIENQSIYNYELSYAGNDLIWISGFSDHSLFDLTSQVSYDYRIASIWSNSGGYGHSYYDQKIYAVDYDEGFIYVLDAHIDGQDQGITLDNQSGVIAEGGSANVKLNAEIVGEPGDTISFDIAFRSNDPTNSYREMPAKLFIVNSPPTTSGLENRSIEAGVSVEINLHDHFLDLNDSIEHFIVDNIKPEIANVSVIENRLILKALEAGSTSISLTGIDHYQDSVSASFVVSVSNTNSLIQNQQFDELTLSPNDRIGLVLSAYFEDTLNHEINYGLLESSCDIMEVSIVSDTMSIYAIEEGNCELYLKVSNLHGDELVDTLFLTVYDSTASLVLNADLPTTELKVADSIVYNLSDYFSDMDENKIYYEIAIGDAQVADYVLADSMLTIYGNQVGQTVINVVATNNLNDTARTSTAISVTNLLPYVVEDPANITMYEFDTLWYGLTKYFADENDEIQSFKVNVATGSISLELAGDSILVISQEIGQGEISISAFDSYGDSVIASVDVEVINKSTLVQDKSFNDLSINAGDQSVIDLLEYFSDNDGNVISFDVLADTAVAQINVNGASYTFKGHGIGETIVTVYAFNQYQDTLSASFNLKVDNLSPELVRKIDTRLISTGEPEMILLSSYFIDENDDIALFKASSSYDTIVASIVRSDTLILEGKHIGTSVLEVKAFDNYGDSVSTLFAVNVRYGDAVIMTDTFSTQLVGVDETIELNLQDHYEDLNSDPIMFDVEFDDSLIGVSIDNSIIKITGISAGDAELNVNAYNGHGDSIQSVVNIVVMGDDELGVYDNVKIVIMPNPTSGRVVIANDASPILSIESYDATGKKVPIKMISSDTNKHEIDLSELKSGVYYLIITTSDKTTAKRVILRGNGQ
ncbi:MAG: S8 family serine peptidase [Cyclobacteriaceae bacterium]